MKEAPVDRACAQRVKMSIRVLRRGTGKKMATVPSGDLMLVLQIDVLENDERMSEHKT